MLGALALSFAMLAVNAGPCAAETTPPAAGVRGDVRSDIGDDASTEANHKLPAPKTDSAAGAYSGEDSAAENELLEAANQARELAGVPPLRMEESLHQAAQAHAQRMVESELLEHRLSGEPPLLERIAQAIGLAPDRSSNSALKIDRAGENIAYATCAPGANDVLMRSEPHRRNLLDREFNIAGVAAIWSKGRLYVVEDFARQVPSYSARESGELVRRAIDEIRQQAGLPELAQVSPPKLDEAACSLAKERRPNAHLLAASYDNRRIVTYTQSRPEMLPPGALRLLRDPNVRQFAVGACYARNAAYPTGMYWVAILLY
jgi:uncharacterized protein YkwD